MNKESVYTFFKHIGFMEFFEECHNINLNHPPVMLEEGHSETIHSRSFITP